MSKYQVKAGDEFEVVDVVVEVEGVAEAEVVADAAAKKVTVKVKGGEVGKTSFLPDWKVALVVSVAVLAFFSGGYAVASGDYVLFDKVVNAVTSVAGTILGKSDVGKKAIKDHSGAD